jgi:hypothetical protein
MWTFGFFVSLFAGALGALELCDMALLEIPLNFIAFGAVRQSEIAYDEMC